MLLVKEYSPDSHHRRVHKLPRSNVPFDVEANHLSHDGVHHRTVSARNIGVDGNHGDGDDEDVPLSLSPDIGKRSEVS